MKKFAAFLEEKHELTIAETIVALDIDSEKFFNDVKTFWTHGQDINELQNLSQQEEPSRFSKFANWMQNNVNPFNVDVQNKWRNIGHGIKGAAKAAIHPWTNAATSSTAAMAMKHATQTGRVQNTMKQLDNLKKTLKSQLGMDDTQVKQVVGGVDKFLQQTLDSVNKHLTGMQEPMQTPQGTQDFHQNTAQHYAGQPQQQPPMARHAMPFDYQQSQVAASPTNNPMQGMSTDVPNMKKRYKPMQVAATGQAPAKNVGYVGY